MKRTAVHLTGLPLLGLAFQTLGIIYSDIGTSPLYVLNGIWPSNGPLPSNEDVIGGISAIIWSITLLPLLKYGGSFALYQGLYPRKELDAETDRTLTGESKITDAPNKNTLKERARWPLLIWAQSAIFILTMADGIFTPAVSVTSAVAGIGVAKPSVIKDIQPISIVFLLALFFVQQFGTAKIAFVFAPISFIWFLILIGTGIYNITFFPGIFRAFDPSRAVLLFIRTKDFELLAGVLLALTGCEALFAKFVNSGTIQRCIDQDLFVAFVYPAIIIAYLGQGARLIHDGAPILQNVFYTTIPGPVNGPLYWIVFVFAILATFDPTSYQLQSFPPLRMHYTSETIQGQVYIPAANWILMILTIVVVGAFKNCCLLAVQMRYVKGWPVLIGVGYFLIFGFFDGLFWGAALKKVPLGAWVPLMIGVILVLVMWLWVWAKALEDDFDGKNRMNLRHFIHQKGLTNGESNVDIQVESMKDMSYYMVKDGSSSVGEKNDGVLSEITRIPSTAVFHKLTSGQGFIRQWPSLPRVVIFLSVCIVPVARVQWRSSFYGVTYYIGFRDHFDVKVDDIIDKICQLEAQFNPEGSAAIVREIRAVSATAAHITAHYHVVAKKVEAGFLTPVVNACRALLIEGIYRRLATMFPETANWLTPADEYVWIADSLSSILH
ncbi:potassium transporter-domain-containing protein [Pholiota molesta]|nr:potassium transporter-domain-containing protein [Pholiota molesta]